MTSGRELQTWRDAETTLGQRLGVVWRLSAEPKTNGRSAACGERRSVMQNVREWMRRPGWTQETRPPPRTEGLGLVARRALVLKREAIRDAPASEVRSGPRAWPRSRARGRTRSAAPT